MAKPEGTRFIHPVPCMSETFACNTPNYSSLTPSQSCGANFGWKTKTRLRVTGEETKVVRHSTWHKQFLNMCILSCNFSHIVTFWHVFRRIFWHSIWHVLAGISFDILSGIFSCTLPDLARVAASWTQVQNHGSILSSQDGDLSQKPLQVGIT